MSGVVDKMLGMVIGAKLPKKNHKHDGCWYVNKQSSSGMDYTNFKNEINMTMKI